MPVTFLKGFRRLRRMTPASAFRQLLFRPMDFYLYETRVALEEVAPVGISPEIRIYAGTAPPPLASRMTDTKILYAAYHEGRLVHVSWVLLDTLLPTQFGLDPDIPVIADCATDAAFRGKRIYPHVLTRIPADLVRRGLPPAAYILVAPDNEASIRGIERAGFVRQARIRGWRVLGFVVGRRISRTESYTLMAQEHAG